MARTSKTPPFCIHKATGQGFVLLDRRRVYLGRHDLPETQQKYYRTVSEWLANGRRLPVKPEDITVAELADRYLEHCDTYYQTADGGVSSEHANVTLAVNAVTEIYADTRCADFGPLALRTVRDKMVKSDLKRKTINRRVQTIKRMFRWGVANELIPETTWRTLEAVEGLRKGRSAAKESTPVTPVPDAHVEAVKPHVSRQVWGLIQLQLHTAARSGELLELRRIDVDTSGSIWTTRLVRHKTEYRGRTRTLYFGANAQAVLKEFFIGKGPADYLFSPADAERERRERQHRDRTVKVGYGNGPGTNRKDDPAWMPGDCYTTRSYCRAIKRGCKLAGVPHWHPHRLRHSAATRIRKELGLEAAQVWLGHANADVTQVYAEVDHARALEIAAQMG